MNAESIFFVVGLGSMGKRRVRCLQALGYNNIIGFDNRKDRRNESEYLYKIQTNDSFEQVLENAKVDALIISVPPDAHHIFMKKALMYNIPFFVEASVVDTDYDEIIKGVYNKKIVAAPSNTIWFHPAVRKIDKIVTEKQLGEVTNVTYHSGQYLPDWHTYEDVSDFYVSKKETGGGREIVPFELTWLTKIFGYPNQVAGMFKKTIDIKGAPEIEDTYNVLLDYDKAILNLVVDVTSRYAIRKMLINFSKGQLIWNWEDDFIQIYNASTEEWCKETFYKGDAAMGYNKNISEVMYIDELRNFINAVNGEGQFFNSLEEDHKVLKMLYIIEQSYAEKRYLTFSS